LYQEFKEFFPDNAVSYFVSYYDYYQPEAYIPQSDTYIEKETDINAQIDQLRLSATTNLLTRKDTIVIASVSCIYNLGSPEEYSKQILELAVGLEIARSQIVMRLNDLQYSRSDVSFVRSTYRIRGDIIDVFLSYEEAAVRIYLGDKKITLLEKFHPLTGQQLESPTRITIYSSKHYVAPRETYPKAFAQIRQDLATQVELFKSQNKPLEAHRINQRVNYDLEMLQELGYVNGVENYSRYFDGRNPGDPPYSLLDYFRGNDDYLLVIDESHITLPQIRGMYNGDRARKQVLIDFGFRLPAALDNRPLRFDEFQRRAGQTVYVSATPNDWEISLSAGNVAEQLIRPTGLIDPKISVRPTQNQVADLLLEITSRVSQKQRVLVTTLTKRMAEDLANYLSDQQVKVHYLHSDIDTLDRIDILDDLRAGKYDVVVGINLLREGLDLPEVSLVAILDADKEGFLRSRTSLIQIMGRAARHDSGSVIMYADTVTDSMRLAMDEVNRRRDIQIKYNQTHNITPTSISKPIRDKMVDRSEAPPIVLDPKQILKGKSVASADIDMTKVNQLTPFDRTKLIKLLTKSMLAAAKELDFETAARLRDRISEISNTVN
jgi:excinuclease ABC subunit B